MRLAPADVNNSARGGEIPAGSREWSCTAARR